MFNLASAAASVLIALIFIFVERIRFRDPQRSESWMSAAGGASAAFVFVVLLPKLSVAQLALQKVGEGGFLEFLSFHSYLLALVGFLVFWALDRSVVVLVGGMIDSLEDRPTTRFPRSKAPLWQPLLYAQAVAFALYAMLVGYLIGESPSPNYAALGLFSLAMALHFLAMAVSLRHELAEAYDRLERWLLAAAILAGWVLAQFTEVPYGRLALWNSLFAGMLIFFVIRHEIPSPLAGRFVPLLIGSVGYSVLALIIASL